MCSSKASGRNFANGDARSFPRPLFIPLLGAGIAGIVLVQVMTPYFGLKVDLKGVNPFASFHVSVEALEKKSTQGYDEGRAEDALMKSLDGDEGLMSKLLNAKRWLERLA